MRAEAAGQLPEGESALSTPCAAAFVASSAPLRDGILVRGGLDASTPAVGVGGPLGREEPCAEESACSAFCSAAVGLAGSLPTKASEQGDSGMLLGLRMMASSSAERLGVLWSPPAPVGEVSGDKAALLKHLKRIKL